jgi:hypothetical protein
MRAAIIAMTILALATPVFANPPLREVKEINDSLLAVGLADEIRKNCNNISGRIFKGIGRLRGIYQTALDMGYTKAEIEAFVDNRVEKDRLKARGRAYLTANGASLDAQETMCVLGRQEISKNSAIGTLLYEN